MNRPAPLWRETSLALALLTFMAVLRPEAASADDRPAAGAPPLSATQIEELRQQAYKQMSERHWEEAQELWNRLSAGLPRTPEFQATRHEAELNLNLLAPLCQPQQSPVDVWQRPTNTAPTNPPENVTPERLLRQYPPGKRIGSQADFVVTGRGVNRKWIFEGEVHFIYRGRVRVETNVLHNDRGKARFEVEFKEVSQSAAVSKQELQLREPSPITKVVWERLEDYGLRNLPGYQVLRKSAEIVSAADPRLRRTLTAFAENLRSLGVRLDDDAEVELLAKLDQLDGVKLEVEYVSGLGVQKIQVLDGVKFTPDQLDRMAHSFSLLADYYLFPVLEKQPGEEWTVRVEDVAGVLGIDYDVDAAGQLTLERLPGGDRPNSSLATLKVKSGEVVIKDPRRRRPDVTVYALDSSIRYSLVDLMVREAAISWKATSNLIQPGHLLFGTEKIRDLEVRSRYSAVRLDVEAGK